MNVKNRNTEHAVIGQRRRLLSDWLNLTVGGVSLTVNVDVSARLELEMFQNPQMQK